MELLKEISNQDIGEKNKEVKYVVRKAARAVLFDGEKIALLFVSKHNYHKLPGGGAKLNENIKKALVREIMEETGCTAEIKDNVGVIVEYRDNFEKIQFSYCFVAEVINNYREQFFTEKEKVQGFQLKWVSLDEAIKLIENDKPDNYEGKFIVKRDVVFLKKAKEIRR